MLLTIFFAIAQNKFMRNTKRNEKVELSNGKKTFYSILIGLISGFINGIFGGGGGMIVVPMLTFILKKEEKIAHATAILIILPLSIVSAVMYIIFGKFNLGVGVPVGIGVILGGVAGALLLKKLSSKWVSFIFCLVMFGAGVKMLFF